MTSGTLLAGLALAALAPASTAAEPAPFYLGFMVGADPVGWGDLPGKDSKSGIEGILDDAARMGLNAIWVTGFDGNYAKEELIPLWLDGARARGLKVALQGSAPPYAIPKGDPEMAKLTREQVLPTWRRLARRWGRHPALLAYSPVEEIGDNADEGSTPTLDLLAEVGRAVAQVDPRHPVTTTHIAMWYPVAEAETRIRKADLRVLVADLYVFTAVHDWTPETSSWRTPEAATAGYLDWNKRYADLARSAKVPFWIVAQGFASDWTRRIGGKVESRPNSRMPTTAEMSFQVWAAILSGTKGVVFFTYQSFREPGEEAKATLEEWETDVGLRTLRGEETTAFKGLAAVAARLKGRHDLVGRLVPAGDARAEGDLMARRFTDPADGSRYDVYLNRDLGRSRPVPEAWRAEAAGSAPEALGPGDGALVPVR